MIALKCDNCGGYFEFGNKKDPNTLDFVYTDKFRNTNLIIRKHICPACMAAVAKVLYDQKRRSDPFEVDLK